MSSVDSRTGSSLYQREALDIVSARVYRELFKLEPP